MSAFARDEEIALFPGYPGAVEETEAAQANVDAVGDAKITLLANHGVLIVGRSIREAHFRAVAFEWRCKQAWMVEAIDKGLAMPEPGRLHLLASISRQTEGCPPGMWEYAIRRELKVDPDMLA
jgi:ribulose-5-phosphate 4-epimerase/fuculose-1-phosphate aldolase